MKKKAEGMSLRETFAIHRRAARDMRRIAPGCFTPFILCAVVEAASPYAVIWLSAGLSMNYPPFADRRFWPNGSFGS